MKKYVIILITVNLFFINLYSQQQVSREEAKNAAIHTLYDKAEFLKSSANVDIQSIEEYRNTKENVLMYEVVFPNKVAVLLSSSKACLPVVGYYFSPTKASALDTINVSVSRDNTKAFGITRSDLGEEMFTVMGNGVTLVKKLRAEAIE
ncbi:MAG: hypothetical protein LBD17_01610, partial [Endomicrobium sp.]|nr:hypothetical protein [Endomicrobium sp.]